MPASATIGNAAELREVYLLAFDAFATDPVTVEQETGGKINVRFARELLGVLTTRKILVEADIDGETVWQVAKPGTSDEVDRAEADVFISDWLGLGAPKVKDAKKVDAKKALANKVATTSSHACYCGCGDQITSKAFYRPGHDARHAGQVGRAIAANYAVKGFDRRELLAELPSNVLVAKAERIAETAIAKIEKKVASKTVKPVEGTVKIGKNVIAAIRYSDGKIVAFDYKKPLSATAIKSFTPNSA